MARHDRARTGAAAGTSDITKPAAYWRAYLGGTLGSAAMIPTDVSGDGAPDVVYVNAGRVFARTLAGDLLWSSPSLSLVTLVTVEDLDGDGQKEVIAASSSQVYVFDGKTGKEQWVEPAGEMGTIGGVRVGDLDGDKKPDLLIQECGCCAVNSGKTGFAYSFGAGYAAAKQLYTLPTVECGGRNAMAILDVDGDGKAEVTASTGTSISVLNGATGAALATASAIGSRIAFSRCLPVNVDGEPGDEMMCVLDDALAKPSGRRLYLLKYTAATKTLAVKWSRDVGDVDTGLAFPPELVTDLDGDGKLEVVISGRVTAGGYTTYVIDAATGTDLATVTAQRAIGVAPIESAKTSLFLTTNAGTLSAFAFDRTASPAATLRFSLPEHTSVATIDPMRVRTSSFAGRTVHLDLTGDGVADLITYKGTPSREMVAYRVSGGTPSALATFKTSGGASAGTTWIAPSGAPDALYFSQNNGVLFALDKTLNATNAKTGGVRFGGYYAPGGWRQMQLSPVVGDLGGSGHSVVVTDSRGTLLRLDARDATNAAPPVTVWERPYSSGGQIVANLDGGTKPGVACTSLVVPVTEPPTYQLVTLKADGNPLWTAPIDGTPFNDVVSGKLDGDGIPDLILQWGRPTDVLLRTRAFNGKDGSTLWDGPTLDDSYGRQPAGFSVFDYNGDGSDDVITHSLGVRVLSGKDGTQIAGNSGAEPYFLPTIFDTDGDGKPEITLHGGFFPARTIANDLKTAKWIGEFDRPFPYGAIAECSTGPVLVEGSLLNSARLKLTKLSGASIGTFTTMVLAGGARYANEDAAKAAKATLGQLTSATVHKNLSGTGGPTAFVGSTDGFLYAIDPCAGSLKFAYDFGAPVGEAVFGDTNADGKDEIVVSVADGYLYGLKQEVLPVPKNVIDTDGASTTDVDAVDATNALHGKWDAVAGATSYEVAAVGPDGKYVTTPAWKDVGNVTQASITATLTPGATYTFAVRAKNASGVGPDGISDGVKINESTTGDAGPETGPSDTGPGDDAATDAAPPPGGDEVEGGGCGCRTAGATTPSYLAAFAAVAGAIVVFRRRRSR